MTESIEQRLAEAASRVRDCGLDLAAVRQRRRYRRRRTFALRAGAGAALAAASVVAIPIVSSALASSQTDRVEQLSSAATASLEPRPMMSPDVLSLPANLPAEFVKRAHLPSCGTYKLGQGEQRVPAPGIACLFDAVGGPVGGELGLSRPTIEGDPLVAWYRALPNSDHIEVFRDTTADRYGSGQWTYEVCSTGRGALEPVRDCSTPQVLADTPSAVLGIDQLAHVSTSPPVAPDPGKPITRRVGSGGASEFNLLTYKSLQGLSCIGWQRTGRHLSDACGFDETQGFNTYGELEPPSAEAAGLRVYAGWAPSTADAITVRGPGVFVKQLLDGEADEHGHRYFVITVSALDPDVVLSAVDATGRVIASRPKSGLVTRTAEVCAASRGARPAPPGCAHPGQVVQPR